MDWLESLTEPKRQAVFAEMRLIRAESSSLYKKAQDLGPRGGQISVGAADYDEFIRADSDANILASLSKGKTPDEAGQDAKMAARESVLRHNRQRKDSTWQRWEGTADSSIDEIIVRLNATTGLPG